MSKSIKIWLFKLHLTDGLFWFRLFGLGLVIKDTNKHPLIFSERNNLAKHLIVGKYLIKPLTPKP